MPKHSHPFAPDFDIATLHRTLRGVVRRARALTRERDVADYSHTKRTLSFMKIITEQKRELKDLRQADKEELDGVTIRLDERSNELNSLYEMLHLQAGNHSSLGDLLQAVVDLIPPAFQHPESTSARIQLPQGVYSTGHYRDSKRKLIHDIAIGNEKVGTVAVCCARDLADHQQTPFSPETKRYLEAVAEILSQIIASERSRVARPAPPQR